MAEKGWIGVDLDGTLAEYTGWKGTDHIGKPVPKMVARVKKWISEGKQVRIMTARVSGDAQDPEVHRKTLEAIWSWSREHIGEALPLTHAKDYNMIELWDDRAVQVIPNTGERADGKD